MQEEKKITPMMEQYLEIKKDYPDAILFYRMGDFYEMFYDDAKKAASILEIALTSRNKNSPDKVPMCGIPIKAADMYLAKLIEKDIKVAVCEQTEDPSKAKGLVKREVVRVVTPGMITDSNLLEEKENNFIASVALSKTNSGLASVDISTGEFKVTETKDVKVLIDEIFRINPGEIIISEDNASGLADNIKKFFQNTPITLLPDSYFSKNLCQDKILEQFQIKSLKGLGCNNMDSGIAAAGSILFYINDTQKQKLSHLKMISGYSLDNHLVIDDVTAKNLELTESMREKKRKGSLLDAMDETATAMGSRLLKKWIQYPLTDISEIEKRHSAVHELSKERLKKDEIRELLTRVYDIERLSARISMGYANPKDLLALRNSFEIIPSLMDILTHFKSPLLHFEHEITEINNICGLIAKAISDDAPMLITEGKIFNKGYNDDLDELIELTTDSKSWLARYESLEKQNAQITTLRVKFNKVFGYFIEVPKTQIDKIPDNYIRKQTLVNCERYITPELKEFEEKVLSAEEKRTTLEYKLFLEIRDYISSNNNIIQDLASFIALLDVLSSFSETAVKRGYVKPSMNTDKKIIIKNGRHPVVENMLDKERFVPNDIYLDNDENQILIITGPNMAGKSTILRQTALIVLMAQTGSYVPAEHADIAVTDRIFTRVGASDNLAAGQSTFMVEMEEAANILNNATSNSLVVMDEIGRGTSTFDGISIAWAVAEHLHNLKGKGVKTLFATHYHELTELENTLPKAKNFNISVKEKDGKISFLRKMVSGGANKSYGIQVAALAGIPVNVVERAKILLKRMESGDHILSNEKISKIKSSSHQMEFFPSPEKKFTEAVGNLNINEMSPVEALNCLNSLIEEAKKLLCKKA